VSHWVHALLASALSGRLWANMTSFTKPEVHNVLQCHQRRTEPRPQVTSTENFVKFRCVVVFEMRANTDRHTDTLVAIPRISTGDKVKIMCRNSWKIVIVELRRQSRHEQDTTSILNMISRTKQYLIFYLQDSFWNYLDRIDIIFEDNFSRYFSP